MSLKRFPLCLSLLNLAGKSFFKIENLKVNSCKLISIISADELHCFQMAPSSSPAAWHIKLVINGKEQFPRLDQDPQLRVTLIWEMSEGGDASTYGCSTIEAATICPMSGTVSFSHMTSRHITDKGGKLWVNAMLLYSIFIKILIFHI